MKLAEATSYDQLRNDGLRYKPSKETRVALELARDIFAEAEDREQPFLYHTPETWAKKWLPSKRFLLLRLPLNAAAMPCEPKIDNLVLKKIHAMETKPIIVDYNKNQVGKTMHGFVPQVIVIDGKHRFKAASLRGETYIMAWVGELAAAEMKAGGPGSGRRSEGAIGSKEDYAKWEKQGARERTPIKAPYGEYGDKANSVRAFGGGGGGGPKTMDPAPGASLVAHGNSQQEANMENRTRQTFAEGKKLKTLNVEDVDSAGTSEGAQKGWDTRGRGHIEDSKPHQKFMSSLANRPGIYGRVRTDYQRVPQDDKEDFRRMTAPRATRNDAEHKMAKELESTGHLKRGKETWDKNGHSVWNITMKGHAGFGLGE